ncbi:MAG: helix-turn-helix transcriptional regulator [Clostridia bacterium]|nr:helix-turn-helix transcriptional regulator [Clostridia bacterium]
MLQELKEMGLSQAMIAREMKTHRQTVNQWFMGNRVPTARSISKMATAMSTLTGKKVVPADVYNLITTVVERIEREKESI